MPTYVYRCVDCSTEQELKHSMAEDPDVYCAACDGYCTRVPQAAGVVLKGRGWYKDSGRKENGEPL